MGAEGLVNIADPAFVEVSIGIAHDLGGYDAVTGASRRVRCFVFGFKRFQERGLRLRGQG